jgi:hypothetical protein
LHFLTLFSDNFKSNNSREAAILKTKKSFFISLFLATLAGIAIAWIDSRPNWDDTAVEIMMILSSTFILGFTASRKPWLIAILVSIWIPLFGIILSHTYGGLVALVPGFIGAYLGYIVRKAV